MTTVAFIGLGTMGYPMAGHLARAGCDVHVYNRTSVVAERWIAEHPGHVAAASPAEAARDASFVFTCVGADDDVRSVTTAASGALSTMPEGSVLVDHTTASAGLARDRKSVV